MKFSIFLFFVLFWCSKVSAQKYDGLALTPPMGWNSWNTFQTNISDSLVRGTADVMVASGMRDAGYTYLVLDDGWMAMKRDGKTGDLVPDPKKFPNGMKVLIDYVHSKGLKFGLYNCAGTKTCAGYPGTRGYEYQDARFYASLGIDYLKFDWCNNEGLNAKESYTTMSKALKAAGRPIVFSLCEWGSNKPWQWAENVGQLWRTTGDISAKFDSYIDHGTWKQLGVMPIVDLQDTLRKFAGPGHWNDPDMLEVGNGMSVNEDRAHFSLWCMLAAPLMAGNDIRKMSKETQAILTNKEVIAINQDAAGIEGFKYRAQDSLEIWVKPLSDDNWAICFLNRSAKQMKVNFNWRDEVITDTIFKKELSAQQQTYKIKNLWANTNSGDTQKPFNAMLPSHDVIVLRLWK
ncbi:MAG: glycoside hydrolase family 27 protein [Bacteroidota bacterium]|nr:glycoside hydrolase family 27 protein [Bacteroidota bacterium]